MKTLIIIPAFNESKNLYPLISEINKYGYDYLIINDCSTDDTEEKARINRFNILNLPINVGLAGVTRIGFKFAYEHGYDCGISIDGDGQHKPEYICQLIHEMELGNDYVVGSRFLENKKPLTFRMIGSRIICLLIRIKTKKTVTDPTSGMRALGKNVLRDFSNSMNFYAEPDALCYCLKSEYRVKEIQVKMEERVEGTSYFSNPLKALKYMLATAISILFVQ